MSEKIKPTDLERSNLTPISSYARVNGRLIHVGEPDDIVSQDPNYTPDRSLVGIGTFYNRKTSPESLRRRVLRGLPGSSKGPNAS